MSCVLESGCRLRSSLLPTAWTSNHALPRCCLRKIGRTVTGRLVAAHDHLTILGQHGQLVVPQMASTDDWTWRGARHEELLDPVITSVMIDLHSPHVPLTYCKRQPGAEGQHPLHTGTHDTLRNMSNREGGPPECDRLAHSHRLRLACRPGQGHRLAGTVFEDDLHRALSAVEPWWDAYRDNDGEGRSQAGLGVEADDSKPSADHVELVSGIDRGIVGQEETDRRGVGDLTHADEGTADAAVICRRGARPPVPDATPAGD